MLWEKQTVAGPSKTADKKKTKREQYKIIFLFVVPFYGLAETLPEFGEIVGRLFCTGHLVDTSGDENQTSVGMHFQFFGERTIVKIQTLLSPFKSRILASMPR